MSRREEFRPPSKKAVALSYGPGDNAPVVVATGQGYLAEKIVEVAAESGVPIYEDGSLSTILTQLKLGQEVPENLYQAIVEIYVYFLKFDPNSRSQAAPPPSPPPAGDEDQGDEVEEEPENG